MPDSNDIPSLADLRRGRRVAARRPPAMPMLFNLDELRTEADAEDAAIAATVEASAPQPSVILSEAHRAQSKSLPRAGRGDPEDHRPDAIAQPVFTANQSTAEPEPEDDTPRIYTVADLVSQVRSLVEGAFPSVTVEGEISNWRPAASGHCYFTLKDGEAQISVVMFRRQASLLRFKPRDGDAVRLYGQLSLYESRGQMQIIAEWMQQQGLGAMLAAVRELKERLRREGLFDRKRSLPPFPRCIGVVTSEHGAALRDIVKVCRRRHAGVKLLLYPAAVQGPNCPREVAAGVRFFSARSAVEQPLVDVVIVARGGGSWEDLHGFDDEQVARAIATCSVPVIVGVGHATDSVIADSAADVCAPTPSAAAELVTATQHLVEERVAQLAARVVRAGRYEILRARQRLTYLNADVALDRSRLRIERRGQRVDDLTDRALDATQRAVAARAAHLANLSSRLQAQHASTRLASNRRTLDALSQRLAAAAATPLAEARTRIEHATLRLEALNPLRVLERGYALVYGPDGTLLRTSSRISLGERITTRLASGQLSATVYAKK